MQPESAPDTPTWRRQLEELISGPYALSGGLTALRAELQIGRNTLHSYRTGRHAASFAVAKRIDTLWRKHFGEQGGTTRHG